MDGEQYPEFDVQPVVRRGRNGKRITLAEALGDGPVLRPGAGDPQPAPAPAVTAAPRGAAPGPTPPAAGETLLDADATVLPAEEGVASDFPEGADSPRPRRSPLFATGLAMVVIGVAGMAVTVSSLFLQDDAPPELAAPSTAAAESTIAVETTVEVSVLAASTTLLEPEPEIGGVFVGDPEDTALPDISGDGKRVVYAPLRQRMWWVAEDGTVVRTALVSGAPGLPGPGLFLVESKSRDATGYDGADLPYLVRFGKSEDGRTLGFSAIPVLNGAPVQSDAELGRSVADLGVRQSLADAEFSWEFLEVGDTIVVVP